MGRSLKLLTSYKTAIVLLLIYASGLAIATFIEKFFGTTTAKDIIYYSPAFFLLYLLLVANFVCTTLKHGLLKGQKYGFIIMHAALLIILAGAFVSHISAKEGIISLREGETVSYMIEQTSEGEIAHPLPFSIRLDQFTIVRYPGSSSPSSFESIVSILQNDQPLTEVISMNNVLDIEGYRLFQASYDKDEKGSILSVNKDVAGRNITYTGYLALITGFLLSFLGKNTRFGLLARQLKQLRKVPATTSILLLCLIGPLTVFAQQPYKNTADAIQENKIAEQHAALFSSLPMQSIDGRIKPVNTFAAEVLRKLHRSEHIRELTPDQFLLSVICFPEIWMHVPFITLKNKDISYQHDLNEGYCAYIELFDTNGNYKLLNDLKEAYSKNPSKRTRFDKDLIKLDEQVNILRQLINKQLINIFPKENDHLHKWYAPGDDLSSFSKEDAEFILQITENYSKEVRRAIQTNNWNNADNLLKKIIEYQQSKTTIPVSNRKIKAELLHNKLDIFGTCKRLYLILGGVLLVFSFISLIKVRRPFQWFSSTIIILICLVICYHLVGIGMRWYIAGYAPWSNSYETMIYVGFITVLAGLFFIRQNTIPLALATLFGGIILFVSGLNWMNPQISPLVPVVKSPWLMIHVAVIVAAYGFFGISFLLGATNLILLQINKKKDQLVLAPRIRELSIINEMSLWIGLALMTTGTFIGAVWANESWGRYWGWDPKETWALITIVVYAVVNHIHLVKKWYSVSLFNLLAVIAFACVLMTYFGVNYLLSGMHSYS